MFTVESLTSILNQLLPEPHAGLLAGFLFGTKASLSKELMDALIDTGTLHIIALSGTNITIISGLVSLTLLRIFSKRVTSVLMLGIIAWFVWFVGASPSILRAALMGSISLVAVIFGRPRWAAFSWFVAIGTMVLINFSWITNISFQLSALASLGIILFGSTGTGHLKRGAAVHGERVSEDKKTLIYREIIGAVKTFIGENMRITLAAQVLTLPVIAFTFRRISIISPVSNLLIGSLIAPVTILGWVTATAGYVFLPLGFVPAWVSWFFLQYIIWIVTAMSRIPFASIQW